MVKLLIVRYALFRKDMDDLTSNHKRGGGVFITVKRNITAELLSINNNNIEKIFGKIKCHEGDLIIGYIYRPPLSPINVYSDHMNTILYIRNKYPDSKLLIMGYCNLASSLPQQFCENILYTKMILAN